jgi:cytochrome c-type biogenesis protein CcsB
MSRLLKLLASPMLMATLIIAFAVSSAIATFVENDYGTQAAWALVYNSWWFELIMILLTINFLSSIFIRKLYSKEKFAIMLFHIGFVIILFGAGVTRYLGQEGMMHIREGETVNWFTSSDKWLTISVDDEKVLERNVNFTPVSKNRFSKSITHNSQNFKVLLTDYIPNATETIVEHFDGHPIASIVLLHSTGNYPVYIRPGKPLPVSENGIGFSYGENLLDIEFAVSDSGLVAKSLFPTTLKKMSDESTSSISPNSWFVIEPQTIVQSGEIQFVNRGSWKKAKIRMVYNPNTAVKGNDVLAFNIEHQDQVREVFVPVSHVEDNPISETFGDKSLTLKYGPKRVELPFHIRLNQFILDRYPGSDSPSSFTSNVDVIDQQNSKEMPFSIYMNNILNYQGYRFYQSSYDPDELGTYLSVNNDFWGTAITYFGYFILIVGIIWALIAPGSRFRKLLSKPSALAILLLLAIFTLPSYAQNVPSPNPKHAREFGKLMVQDQGGRMKPLSTLSGEVLRKLNRSNSFLGQSPEQIFLSMSAFPDHWQHTPVIHVKNKDLKKILGVRTDLAAFIDFFDHQSGGAYKLSNLVKEAFAVKPSQRTALQKDLIKVDERINVLYMVFSGQMARVFPDATHPNDKWLSLTEASERNAEEDVKIVADLFAQYLISVRDANNSGNWQTAESYLSQIQDYQYGSGSHLMPSRGKVVAEVFSNRMLFFERLIPIYGLTGLVFLVLVFFELFRRSKSLNKVFFVLSSILLVGFLAHTFAIGLRWYIAGRAPLSNGFESMVYVAWAAMLAGFVFAKRSRVVLPATALLSTLTLFVAHLSWMDPEITNLVPVLKSYWLTIHVAIITASYGFFGLSAILGLFNLALFSFKSKSNRELIESQVQNITVINELNLTLGLYLMTIGSFLGAVWANESWGRYWGWDPKETWALITILVYTFILHMRLIPSFKSVFAFNFASLIGIGSVLMTYFGVNYYLSGLHSYAGGDSIPVPSWLLYVVAAVFSLGFFAWYNNKLVEDDLKPKDNQKN